MGATVLTALLARVQREALLANGQLPSRIDEVATELERVTRALQDQR